MAGQRVTKAEEQRKARRSKGGKGGKMTIQETKEKKRELEQQIYSLILDFEESTGCNVYTWHLDALYPEDGGTATTIGVTTTVRI